jgi:hypothetical protein
MKFSPHTCPTCGEVTKGTVETVEGIALLDFDEDGDADWEGTTEISWDTQKTITEEDGIVTLVCDNGHSWQATKGNKDAKVVEMPSAAESAGYDAFLQDASEAVAVRWMGAGGKALEDEELQQVINLLDKFFADKRP